MSEMVKLPGHHHPLLSGNHTLKDCFECRIRIQEGPNYNCTICDQAWHINCMPTTPEINHPCHPHHALKLLIDGAPAYTDGKCHFCRRELKSFVYHCFTCNITLDMRCVMSPKHVTIGESKCHNHPLTIVARLVSFCCNVCGTQGERNPYVCLACSFMVHEDCINRPNIININRHDHRISHTYSLGFGNRVCKVCRLNIEWMYGAYSCSKCPDFVVHSLCATAYDVWDGQELQGKPEEEEVKPMFKVIGESLINHQMHPSHNLRLTGDVVVRDEGVRCQLCEGSVYSDKFYSCMECDYVLHEPCAYFPKRKKNSFTRYPCDLKKTVDGLFFMCVACCQVSTGYSYVISYSKNAYIDLRCAAIDWSCDHECHPHSLFLTNLRKDTCGACHNSYEFVLRCVECKFNLCYKCATYPKKIKHRCDDHPLVLSFGDKEQHETYWCTVCETKADPKKWFYECEHCGIVCHIHCVLGDFANVNPGLFTLKDGNKSEVVPKKASIRRWGDVQPSVNQNSTKKRGVVRNNGVTRPHCHYCATRCLAPFIYCVSEEYFCSFACLVPNSEAYEALMAEQKSYRSIFETLYVGFEAQRSALAFIDSRSYHRLS